jgi:acyl-CoA reductase-like NAD-dependent aldehyde dehydrogenase
LELFHLVAPRARRKEYHMTGTSVSAVTAYSAHREWASRPPDERYVSVHALYDAAHRERRCRIEEHTIETGEFRTEADGEALTLR